jgi:hypothetical protein
LPLLLAPSREQWSKLSHSGQACRRRRAGGPGHRAFFLGTGIEEAQERPLLPTSGGAGAAPPPPNHRAPRPAGGSHCLEYHLGRAGGWQGGQLRVLCSPSSLHTKEPRTGGPPGGRGVREPDSFLRKPLGYHLGRAGGWQGPPEGPIARARQPFRAPQQGTQGRGATGGAGSPRTRGSPS